METHVKSNTDKILEALSDGLPKTRQEICRITGLPRTTVYDNIVRLIKSGVPIVKEAVITGRRGRPIIMFRLGDTGEGL